VLQRNWRCSTGELDIVAVDGECLVACEVKTRSSATFGAPEEAVTPVKLRRLRQLAARWLTEAESLPDPRPAAVRVDVIAIAIPRRGAPGVRHLVGVG
jgi:putative endonuclease